MRRLAEEGKPISRIMSEDFPNVDYWDIYFFVYSGGHRSATGIKRMISNRLKSLQNANPSERQKIIKEIEDLVWYLYNNFKKRVFE